MGSKFADVGHVAKEELNTILERYEQYLKVALFGIAQSNCISIFLFLFVVSVFYSTIHWYSAFTLLRGTFFGKGRLFNLSMGGKN